MWERFTTVSKHVIDETRREAGRLGSDFVRDYHITLGICRVPECVAARALKNLNVDLDGLSRDIEQELAAGRVPVDGFTLTWTQNAKRVMEQAVVEARHFKHSYIGTEHILLGLIADDVSEEKPGLLAKYFERLTGKKVAEDATRTSWRKLLPSKGELRSEVERLLRESNRDTA